VAYQYIEDNPQFVVNGFEKAGISRALDNGTAAKSQAVMKYCIFGGIQ